MLLNEDFFNDIEIKDEDLTAEVPVEEPAEESKTPRELIEHKVSESEMFLTIRIIHFRGEFDIWHRIERIMKRVKYMFDIYNINISEPFLTYKDVSFKILKDKEFPNNCTLIQHKGCNLYFPEDKLRKYEIDEVMNSELNLFVFLDKKIPVFKTARSAYNFAISLDKCLWKDVTDKKDNFRWCDFYNIDNVYNGDGIITTRSFENSYVTGDGNYIYKSVLNIVPEELAE